jgi:polysaccharide export outer membrane protein
MFRRLLLCALLLLSGSFFARAEAQIEPAGRPRRTQTSPEDGNRGQTRSAKTDTEEAKRLYKVAVKYGHAGLFQQAAEGLEQAVALKPDYGDAYLTLGHVYCDLRQWERAVENIQRGLALKPNDKVSRDRLVFAQTMLQQENLSRQHADADPDGGRSIKANGSSSSLPEADSSKEAVKHRTDDQVLTRIYRIGPGDVLDVRFSDHVSAQSTLFTVSAAGFIEHPNLSAPLKCAGLTTDEIALRIQDDLRNRSMIKAPKVSVAVEEYISHTILVSGLVRDPGTKSLKREGIPLYVVVADAQPAPEAGRVSVQRNASNESFMFDLSETSALKMLVRPGDVISLAEKPAQFFYMSGQVKSPGEKLFHRGLTLTQAIIAAGGLSSGAQEAEVARDNGKGFLLVTRYKLGEIDAGRVPDPAIQPGDRITIVN